MKRKILIFGNGYVAKFLAKFLLKKNIEVFITSRKVKESSHLIIPYNYTAINRIKEISDIFITVPPNEKGDIILQDKILDNYLENLNSINYFSSTSVYGNHQGAWVNENSTAKPTSNNGKNRLLAEQQWQIFVSNYKINLNILRLSGIYGPERNAIYRIKNGLDRSIVKENHCFSRIHIDDIIQVCYKILSSPNIENQIYNLADNLPCNSHEINSYAARLINYPEPKIINFLEVELSEKMQNFFYDSKKVSNEKLKSFLGIKLKYPTYKEGLEACL